MSIQLEKITPQENSSFRWLINPKLNDFYFWHFHPEIELVLIEAENGTRHIGNHIEQFLGGDLAMIGSNIPHLNFDFGIKKDYNKTVLHISPSFLSEVEHATPELKNIIELFEKAKKGIVFGEQMRHKIKDLFLKIHLRSPFEQFIEVLRILKTLAETDDYKLLNQEEEKYLYTPRERERLKKVSSFIADNFQRKIEIQEVANLANLSEPAFCRYFKKMTKLTFSEFLNHYRINYAKKLLMTERNVSEVCFESGFESLSYFNRTFKKITGENPSSFKKRW